MKLKPADLGKSFEARCQSAATLLTEMCADTDLGKAMHGASRWAVVGGVVRDLLIRSDLNTRPMWRIAWPDIDIAVAEGSLKIDHRILHVSECIRNTYGGLKVASDRVGSIDMWLWPNDSGRTASAVDWSQQLSSVEFGVNAAAFVWPEKRICVHPQWKQDVAKSQVETLTDRVILRNLHVMRGLALAAKLSYRLDGKVRLGPKLWTDVEWLIGTAGKKDVSQALSYLQSKVANGRWPKRVKRQLEESVNASRMAGCAPSGAFCEALGNTNLYLR